VIGDITFGQRFGECIHVFGDVVSLCID
jgi:hypothetical protein